MKHETVDIILNGEPATIATSQTVAALLEHLKLTNVLVAVEINRTVVPRAVYTETTIHEGDVVEVVHFVGGG